MPSVPRNPPGVGRPRVTMRPLAAATVPTTLRQPVVLLSFGERRPPMRRLRELPPGAVPAESRIVLRADGVRLR